MVCEAASSGRKVSVLMLSEEKARLPKRHKVYAYMEEHAMTPGNTDAVTDVDLLGGFSTMHCRSALTSSYSTSSPLQDTEAAAVIITQVATYL